MVAEYYPRRRDPTGGVWAHRQALAAGAEGADVRVLALERPVPPAASVEAAARGRLGPIVSALRGFAGQPRRTVLDGIDIEYVRFLAPPRERAYASWHHRAAAPLARALERLHASWGIDLVHAHYALPAGGAALAWAARRGVPLATSVHGGDVLGRQLSTPPARAAVGAVLRSSEVVMCNSRATLSHAAALAGSGANMRVVHLGAAPPATPQPRREHPTVATLAHVIPRKRHADVLRALHLLAGRGSELRWLVIGEGPERPAVEALAAELGVADRIEWAGRLAPERALEVLSGAHVMAMPSLDEAFGVAYVEALACGVPAIGCRGEWGPEEVAAIGEGMTLVPPADVEALARALETLLEDPRRLRDLGAAARRTAVEHFSWSGCGEATVAAYEQAIAGRER